MEAKKLRNPPSTLYLEGFEAFEGFIQSAALHLWKFGFL